MAFATSFGDGDVLLWFVEFFLFVVWFWILIMIFGDLFRDKHASGWAKAFWFLFVVFIPLIGILTYFIVRGGGMAERAAEQQKELQAQMGEMAMAGKSPADQISQAKALLESGAIDQAEFDQLKAKALQ
jgi:hypothetical protein